MTHASEENAMTAEQLAKQFHEAYERLAPDYGYRTRTASAVPWDQVPENNRRLMTAVAAEILESLGSGVVSRPLWCVHVYGPDDLHAAESSWEAQTMAESINAAYTAARSDGMPDINAVAESWPYDAESHAADLAKRQADPEAYWS